MNKDLKQFYFFENREAVADFRDLLSAIEQCIRHVEQLFEKETAFERKGVTFAKYFFMQSCLRLTKEAYNAILSGCFNGVASLCRCMIENYVCCALIAQHPEEPLSALWELHSLKSAEKELSKTNAIPAEMWEMECDRLGLDPEMLERKEFKKDYGWAFPVIKNLNFKGLADAVDPSIYRDYRHFCNYSHGTSLMTMRFSFTFYNEVLPLFANLYYYFTCMTELFYDGDPDEQYTELCIRIGEEYERACEKAL